MSLGIEKFKPPRATVAAPVGRARTGLYKRQTRLKRAVQKKRAMRFECTIHLFCFIEATRLSARFIAPRPRKAPAERARADDFFAWLESAAKGPPRPVLGDVVQGGGARGWQA